MKSSPTRYNRRKLPSRSRTKSVLSAGISAGNGAKGFCSGCHWSVVLIAMAVILTTTSIYFFEHPETQHHISTAISQTIEASLAYKSSPQPETSLPSEPLSAPIGSVSNPEKDLESEQKAMVKPQFMNDQFQRPKKESVSHGETAAEAARKGSSKRNKSKRKNKRKDPNDWVFDFEADWGLHDEWKYIRVMNTTKKMLIKKDRRVVIPPLLPSSKSYEDSVRSRARSSPSNVVGSPSSLLEANKVLQQHPLRLSPLPSDASLADAMYSLQHSVACHNQLPIFLTMATVGDDLYWQLIENFVYTSVKYGTSSCSLVICVSDPRCVAMCDAAFFPCFDYKEKMRPLPSVMEQIAMVKLYHVPQALSRGVDVFMLDLDVGFLGNPQLLVRAFRETPIVDILVQEDYIFIMDRYVWEHFHWKRWHTEPLPNIGLFLCRGNNRTAQVFSLAWEKYQKLDDAYQKSQPGRDQNIVLDAMRIGRGNFALKYAYFDNYTAPLMDKLVMFHGTKVELGGVLIDRVLENRAVAMHTTCYEKSTKVMGLKAANAFWNPRYYDPLRPTLTKQLLYSDDLQLLDEVRSLLWLGLVTGRSVIVPNIYGSDSLKVIEPYRGQRMWPGFRVVFLKRSKGRNQLRVEILEPSFYWRIQRDYEDIPQPQTFFFNQKHDTLGTIRDRLLAPEFTSQPRVILHPSPPRSAREKVASSLPTELAVKITEELAVWANDSVGLYGVSFNEAIKRYRRLPSLKQSAVRDLPQVQDVLQGMRTCKDIFTPPKGNRTCFQICD